MAHFKVEVSITHKIREFGIYLKVYSNLPRIMPVATKVHVIFGTYAVVNMDV